MNFLKYGLLWLVGREPLPEPEPEPDYIIKDRQAKFIYRPQNLSDYIGQNIAKSLVKLNIEKVLNVKPSHFLISGTKGTGKTTLAYIIANQLDYKINYVIGGTFTVETLKSFLIENQNDTKGYILFIDEIHSLDKKFGELLYPLLEDFILPTNGASVKPFIFIGATTEKATLIKKFAPLLDRISCQIVLEPYIAEDIEQILVQYNNQIYKENIPKEIFVILSKNSRYTPRIAIALFDDYIVCKDINLVLQSHRIIKNSLTDIDFKILKHLAEIKKPVGEEALSIIAGIERIDYHLLYEPFLMTEGYISRTGRGRILTIKGTLLLQELNNGNSKM